MSPDERRQRRAARQRERWATDPEFRAHVLEQQREYRQRPEYKAKTIERKRRWIENVDPEHIRAKRKQWKAAENAKPVNRKRQIERARRAKLARMGTSVEEVARLQVEQRGLCALCRRDNGGKPLLVDHCHRTGRFRALLCSSCNTGLGLLQDSPDLLRSAIQYIEGWAAAHQEEIAA